MKIKQLPIYLFAGLIGLSSASFVKAQEQETDQTEEHQHAHDKYAKKHEMRGAKRDNRRAEAAARKISRADSNKDGKLDLSEYLANAERHFIEMDSDSNGFVTQQEAKEWNKKKRAEHRKKRAEHKKQAHKKMHQDDE